MACPTLGPPCAGVRASWSELQELTQARGRLFQDANTAFQVHRDLLGALAQIQVSTQAEEGIC